MVAGRKSEATFLKTSPTLSCLTSRVNRDILSAL